MVMKSIVFVTDGPARPPPKIPLVAEEHPARVRFVVVKSPKSVALPVVAMVMKSIVFVIGL